MSPAPVDVQALPPPSREVVAAGAAISAVVQERWSTRDLERLSYARDLWPLALLWLQQGKLPPPPDAVVWPETDEEVAGLIALARERKFAVVPFGGGSGVCGGTVAMRGGLTMDLKRFDSIGAVDPDERTVDVGAGVLGETLERHLAARGWTLGHSPVSIAASTVGGWLATRSAGQFSSRYGKIEDMVVSVRGVFGTGAVFATKERPHPDAALTPLLLGSEGVLCAFTSATLRVHPTPETRLFRAFEFPSLESGFEAVRRLFREGLRPAAVRLLDPLEAEAVDLGRGGDDQRVRRSRVPEALVPALWSAFAREGLSRPGILNPLTRLVRSKARLVLVFEGERQHAEAEAAASLESCRLLRGEELGEGPARHWFHHRNDVNFRYSELRAAGGFVDTMEVSTSWDRVTDVYQRVRSVAARYALVLCQVGHAYADGCALDFTFLAGGGSAAEREERYHRLWRDALGAAVSAGANVSHHHGVGLLKGPQYQDTLGDGRQVLAALKRHFDPDGVMNPGKLGL